MKISPAVKAWAASLSIGALAAVAHADDTFTKVPVQINVLKGVTVTDNDLAEIVKEANKILKKAKIQLEFDKSKNITRDFNDQGNNNSKIETGEDAKLDKFSVEELEKKFGKGKGYKVVITDEIHGDSTKGGLSPHDPDSPVTYLTLSRPKNKNQTLGNDLAHEFSHVFTLGRGHKIDGSTNADNTGHHTTNKKNLMYPYNNGDTIVRGTDLTEDQIKEIQSKAKKRGASKVKTTLGAVVPQNTRHGSFSDALGDTGTAHVDLFGGTFFVDHGSNNLDAVLDLNGLFPDDLFRSNFSIFLDTDNNAGTGETFGVFEGVDKAVGIQIFRPGPGADLAIQSSLFDPVAGTTKLLPDALVERVDQFFDPIGDDTDPLFHSYRDKINQIIPLDDIGTTTDTFRIGVDGLDIFTSQFDVSDFTEFEFRGPPGLEFDLDVNTGAPGDTIPFLGSGFQPNTPVDLFLDDGFLMSVMSSGGGDIFGDFVIPNLDADEFFITAREGVFVGAPPADGAPLALGQVPLGNRFDFSILTVVPEPTTATALTLLSVLGLSRARKA